MHGWREPSSTKKNPAPTGEEEGQVSPAWKEEFMYSDIACVSGPEREYTFARGGVIPGNRLIAQSYAL